MASLMDFVVEQNAEPQAVLLSLVPKKKMREANQCNLFPHLRPRFVVRLLELVQERHGPGSVDEERGCVTESTKDKITMMFSDICCSENRFVWFPCPRPIVMFPEDFLCFKFVIEVGDKHLESLESPTKKPRVESTVNREDMIHRILGCFLEYLKSRGVVLQGMGVRAWNLTSDGLHGGLQGALEKDLIALATSLICMESEADLMLEEFCVYMRAHHEEIYSNFHTLTYKHRSSCFDFEIEKDGVVTHGKEGSAKKRFTEFIFSNSGSSSSQTSNTIKTYCIDDDIDPAPFNHALQFVSLSG
jgi:hypothetical protein